MKYKWIVVALLSCAYFFHQADRALFGLLTIPIQNELGLTDIQIGWINTALSWTLAVMTMIAGFAGDKFSRKWIITISLIFWSLTTMAMGFVGEWKILGFTIPAFLVVMFFRSIATGGGESFYGPSAMALLASHHGKTRSLAFSIHQGALYFGLMTSGVITAWLLGFLGSWREVFIAFGAAGFLLGLAFIFVLKDGNANMPNSPSHGALGDRALPPNTTHGSAGTPCTPPPHGSAGTPCTPKNSLLAGLKAFFANPSAMLATSGFVAIVFVNNAYLFWAPKFMASKFAVNVGEAGRTTMFYHHLFAFIAILVGGAITDRFVSKWPRFRLGFQIVSLLLGAPCLILLGLSSSMSVFVIMTALYGVFRGCFEVNTHASVFDVVAPEYRSTVVGCMIMCAFFVGGLSGIAMGALSDAFGVKGFEIGFAIMGGTYILAALLMAISFFFTFHRNRL